MLQYFRLTVVPVLIARVEQLAYDRGKGLDLSNLDLANVITETLGTAESV